MKDSFLGLAMRRSSADPRSELASMATGQSGQTSRVVVSESSGVSFAGTDADSCLVDTGDLVGAAIGTPFWAVADLEGIRREAGLPESLAVAYARFGIDLVDKLRGPFSLALMDTAKDLSFLAIDRMGICQLHYSPRGNSGLAFASRGSLLRLPDGSMPAISDQSVYNYLYFHVVPSPETIFQNQYKLQPGERVVFNGDDLLRERYWVPEFRCGNTSRPELEDELRHLMRASVKRAAAHSNTGAFLSGGIDSSTIAGMLSEVQDPSPTFTIGFDEKGYDETSFAQVTSTYFGNQQHEYFVTPEDVVNILPTIADAYDEPFGNSSVVPTYYCAKMALDSGVNTLLAGDGGDELFAGNTRYVTQQIFNIYDRTPGFLKSLMIDPLALKLPGGQRFMPTRKLRSYVTQAKVPMPQRLETYNYLNRSPLEQILHPALLNNVDERMPAIALGKTYDASQASSIVNRMLELDWKITLADNDLRKVNTMCDLAGVSVRYPFLDDDLVAFSERVPEKMKISRFRLRHFFKHAMKNYLPPEVLKKSKHGFGLPFGVWMNSHQPLQELAYDCLADIGKRGIIQPDYLQQLVNAHRSTHAHYYGEFIWVLMALELWFKQHGIRYEAGANR